MAGDDSDLGWAGALMLADALDDLKACRLFFEGYAKAAAAKKPRRR
jgi:hypothetical protein